MAGNERDLQSPREWPANEIVYIIVAHGGGITTYFHLSRSVNEDTLLAFEKPHEYPSNVFNDIPYTKPTLLSEILVLLEKDKRTEMLQKSLKEIPKTHVIFATCMAEIDPSIDLKWKSSLTGLCRREIITGGKRKKINLNDENREEKYHAKNITQKNITHKKKIKTKTIR